MLRYAVVQLGQCVFGAGETAAAAYEDAALWMDEEAHTDAASGEVIISPVTAERVREWCQQGHSNRVNGAIVLMDSEHPEFDSYMTGQGGYKKSSRGWVLA